MHRPTFLIAEPEGSESISVRKLVLETARYNVLTAYTQKEAVEMFNRYPRVDAVFLHARIAEKDPKHLVGLFKQRDAHKPIFLLSPHEILSLEGADLVISSYDPQALRARFGLSDGAR